MNKTKNIIARVRGVDSAGTAGVYNAWREEWSKQATIERKEGDRTMENARGRDLGTAVRKIVRPQPLNLVIRLGLGAAHCHACG